MSIAAGTAPREEYAGNGATTDFSFPYKFFTNTDLVVIVKVDATGVETTKTITTHYTVAGTGEDAGGTVTMLSAPASGETLIIYQDPPIEQGLDLTENDSLPAESLEARLDRLVLMMKRLKDRMDRGVRLTDGFSESFDPRLPAVLAAGNVLVVNDDADGFDVMSSSDILEEVTESDSGFAITDGMSATNVTDMTVDAASYSSAIFTVEVVRSTTIFMHQDIYLQRRNSAWELKEGPLVGTGDDHGLTWSVSETGGVAQVRIASDSVGSGTLKWKRRSINA